jgi:hypothetical protein
MMRDESLYFFMTNDASHYSEAASDFETTLVALEVFIAARATA